MRNIAMSRTLLAVLATVAVLATLPAQAAAQGQGPYQFHSLTPCRLADTRFPAPANPLLSNTTRTFQVQGLCGIPAGAKAAALNVTAVGPNGPGHLTLWPTGITKPVVSSLNFAAGEPAIANGAIVPLAATVPDLSASAYVAATGGRVNLVLDVTGYFE
jgi:hypothetical protein